MPRSSYETFRMHPCSLHNNEFNEPDNVLHFLSATATDLDPQLTICCWICNLVHWAWNVKYEARKTIRPHKREVAAGEA